MRGGAYRGVRVAGAKYPNPFTWTGVPTDFWPHSIGVDGLAYGHTGARQLARTTDGGQTLELGADFAAYCQPGEYVIWCTRTTAGYLVGTSSDVSVAGNFGGLWLGPTFTGTYERVAATRGMNEFAFAQGVGANGQTHVLAGEYSTDMPQPVHVLRLTKDGGQSFTVVAEAKNVDTSKNSHFHAPCIDSSRTPVRYVYAQGDNQNSVFAYSDDECGTFTEMPIPVGHPLYQADSSNPQPTVVGVFPGGLMFTSPDRQLPAGIWTQPSDGTGTPTSKWRTPRGEPSHNMFGRQPFAQAGDVAVVPIPDRFVGTSVVDFVATGDAGLTWHLISEVALSGPGNAGTGLVGPDSAGLIYWRSNNNPAPWGANLLVAPLPTFWTVP